MSVNCAAVPRELIASELFGHEKGAFTGATQRRLGRFELAHGGTIFLDEVGDLPMETQIALLRVLQEREFERVGGTASVRVDVRVIAATNRDLQAAIEAGTFRSDLFYRLNVFPIAVPALRERADDISLLVEYFIDRYARKAGKTLRRINKRTLDRLRSYPWPGNVRELQNVIERSVIVCETDEFRVDESWLSTAARNGQPSRCPKRSPATRRPSSKTRCGRVADGCSAHRERQRGWVFRARRSNRRSASSGSTRTAFALSERSNNGPPVVHDFTNWRNPEQSKHASISLESISYDGLAIALYPGRCAQEIVLRSPPGHVHLPPRRRQLVWMCAPNLRRPGR